MIADGVAVAADVAEREGEFFDRGDGAGGVGDEVDLGEVLLELFGRKIGEENAAHAGAVGGEAAADVEIDGHDAVDLGAGNVDDVFAVECRNGEGLSEGGGHAVQDGLGGGGEGV